MRTSGASAVRWGSGRRAGSIAARKSLLDAAICCYERLGVSNTTIADIAAQAKVTRPTVYRYFPGYQEVLAATVRREMDKLWIALQEQLRDVDNFGDYVVEALIYTLRYASRVEARRFLFAEDTLPVIHRILVADREYLLHLVDLLEPVYERMRGSRPCRRNPELLMVCEWFSRLIVSFLLKPSLFYQTEDELRRFFGSMVSPVFAR